MPGLMGPMGGPMVGVPMGGGGHMGANSMATGPDGMGPGGAMGPALGSKQPNTMEAQYMQQQSQIFVFSTTLANKAAEAVLQGQFQTIIAFHCSQPGTKKFLEVRVTLFIIDYAPLV